MRPLSSTVATRMPSERNISVLVDMVSARPPTAIGSDTCTYAPGSNSPSRLGRLISICIERVAASIDAAVRATSPPKLLPRSSACVTVTFWPALMRCAYDCGTLT